MNSQTKSLRYQQPLLRKVRYNYHVSAQFIFLSIYVLGDDPVECPMCHKKVKYRILNSHMDKNCKDLAPSDSVAKSWSKLMSGASGNKNTHHSKGKYRYNYIFYIISQRTGGRSHTIINKRKKGSDSDDEHALPIATYTTLKDKQLKDMLFEQDLPVTGDRPLWEQRHQRYAVFTGHYRKIFNAYLTQMGYNIQCKLG